MSDPVRLELAAGTGIARVTFNRPNVLNAADVALAQGFLDVVRRLQDMAGLRCVVLTGAGRAFMAGGDVAAFAGRREQARSGVNALLDALNPALLGLRSLDAPILAGVRGVAAGAGLSLALAADLILASRDARFLLAYDRLGVTPDCGGSWFLPRRLGVGRANELMMLSRKLDAGEALAWGLVTETAAPEDFDARLEAMARQLASGPTRATGAFRRLTDRALGSSLAAHLEAERQAFLALTETGDFAEGTAAFLEKRPAVFRGS